jgi:hypothetical protein
MLQAAVAAAAVTLLYWPAMRGAQIPGFRDMLQTYAPMKDLFWRGASGLWNDHAFGGSSILPDLVQQPFYLPNLVFRLLRAPAWPGIAIFLWLHALFGLWAAFALARRFAPEGAAIAAAVFALCGFSLANASNLQWACACAWVPAVLLAADAWGECGGPRRAALLALALPQPLLAGDPLLFALLALAAVLLAWWRAPKEARPVRLREAVFIAAAALVLTSPQLLATLRALPSMTRGAGFSMAEREQWSLHPARLAELFVPRLFGPLFSDGFWGAFTVSAPWKRSYIHSIYAGVAGPALAVLAVRERAARPWLVLCLGSLPFALGEHFFHLYGFATALPVVKAFRYPERMLALIMPGWAMLLAIGAERLFRLPPRRRAALLAASAVFALAALALTALLTPHPDRAAVLHSAVQVAAAGTACVFAVLLPRGAPLAFAVALTVDLCAANAELLGFLPREPFREEPAACTAIDKASGYALRNSFRVYVDQERLEKLTTDFGEQRERQYNFGKRNLLQRCGFREAVGLTSLEPSAERELWMTAGPLRELRVLGTRFVISAPGNARVFGAREVSVDQRWQFAVDELPEPPPLIFRPARVEQIAPEQLYAAAARRPELLGSKIAALESTPLRHLPDPGAQLLELSDEPARIDFRTAQQQPGYWIVAATLDEDWSATVDGESAALEQCDFVRRAVWVPPGEHRVTLRYRPFSPLAIFGFSLALCAGLVVLACRRTA